MRLRKGHHGSSMDLLLDTITNTFGGVLFLAILVAILLQITGHEVEQPEKPQISEAELRSLETKLSSTVATLDTLARAVEAQDANCLTLAPPDTKHQLEEMQRLRIQRDQLVRERLAALEKISSTQADIRHIQKEISQLDEDLKKATQEQASTLMALKSEIQSRTQTARLPSARSTYKNEVALILRYGHLYVLHRYDANGYRQLNTDDMVVISEGASETQVTPKPYAGIAVSDASQAKVALAGPLGRFDPQTEYFAIGVWRDSFDQFVYLKHVLVQLGFNYRLLPIKEGGKIIEANVKNPLVQ